MKKKITLLLMLALIAALVCVFTACDLFGEPEHTHKFEHLQNEQAPTCVSDGVRMLGCDCGAQTQEPIPATGVHTKGEVIEATAPTCTENGTESFICSVCGETLVEAVNALGHTTTPYEEVNANCVGIGYTGGTYCSVCEEVLTERTEIPATGEHTEVNYEDVAPICGAVGYTGGTYCSVCEIEMSAKTEIEATGEHTSADYEDVAPTCGVVGYTGGTYCSVCETELTERTEIPATGEHTEVEVPGVSATCTATGLTAGKQCTVCELFTVEQTEIAKVPHSYSYTVETAPQFEVAGLGKYTCSVCSDSYEEEIPALTYQPSDVWQGDKATGFASGDGTSANPYVIETAAQLAFLASEVNRNVNYNGQYFVLANDIILNDITNYKSWSKANAPANKWTPIGNYGGCAFMGNFNGCGYSVRGLYNYQKKGSSGTNIYAGLFGQVTNGSVKNLNVTEAYVYSEHGAAGGIVGYVDASDSTIVIDNCTFDGTVIGVSHAGGIVGWARVGWYGFQSASNRVDHDGTLKITYCTVNGKISSSVMSVPSNESYVGGIAGYCFYNCGQLTVEGCKNSAEIISRDMAGGILGSVVPKDGYSGSMSITVSYCTNEGKITANNDAGGIASVIQINGDYSDYGYNSMSIRNCYNTGDILIKATTNVNTTVGGLFGRVRASNETYSGTVENCYNTGNIVMEGTGYQAGGLVGNFSIASTSKHHLKNCFNSGNITTVSTSYVGGLFGYASISWRYFCEVDSCYNTGKVVSGMGNVGGIAGYASDMTFSNIYNLGDVEGADKNVGGIFGQAETITLTTSYNAGKVSGNSTYVGAIAGKQSSSSLGAFFLEGCATDGQGFVQGVYGQEQNRAGSTANSLTESKMYNSSSFKNFDFSGVWEAPSSENGTYPTLKKVVKFPEVTE